MWNEKTVNTKAKGKIVEVVKQKPDKTYSIEYFIEYTYKKNNKIRTHREPIRSLFVEYEGKEVEIDINLIR